MNVASPIDPARIERNIRALVRSRFVFALLMIALPLAAHALFERQAKRLDALGDHGRDGTATVTGVSGEGTVFYAYEVDGASYDWSVKRTAAPYPVGATFPILYVPEIPSFSRPGSDHTVATKEAASNRAFARNAELIIFLFFAVNVMACHFSLRRLRGAGLPELNDARAYRNRLIFAGLALATLVVPMIFAAVKDAHRNGESMWGVVLGFGFGLAVLGGGMFFMLREGRANVAARTARMTKWVAPLAVIVAGLRLIVWLVKK